MSLGIKGNLSSFMELAFCFLPKSVCTCHGPLSVHIIEATEDNSSGSLCGTGTVMFSVSWKWERRRAETTQAFWFFSHLGQWHRAPVRNYLLTEYQEYNSFSSSQDGEFYWRSPGNLWVFALFTKIQQMGGEYGFLVKPWGCLKAQKGVSLACGVGPAWGEDTWEVPASLNSFF